jgi:hypothetical protein
MDYVLWGISFVNIKMLLGDIIVHLTDYVEERVFNGDNEEELDKFLREFND